MIRSVRLLGLDFADMDAAEAAGFLAQRSALAPFRAVVTPNADHLVRLHRLPQLMPLYRDALMCLLDSRVIAGAARVLGVPAPRVAPGSDLTELLLARHVAAGERVTIVGLRPAWLPELVARCSLTQPAHYDPPQGLEHDATAMRSAVAFVLAHPARFVFLALGSPQQEMLAAAIRATGRATGVGLCIGGSLDFLSGNVRRAPLWLRQIGCEWLHRLGTDPGRLARRYLCDCPMVFPLLLRERLRLWVVAHAPRDEGIAKRETTRRSLANRRTLEWLPASAPVARGLFSHGEERRMHDVHGEDDIFTPTERDTIHRRT